MLEALTCPIFPAFDVVFCVWLDEAYPTKCIASHIPSVASADLGCVTSRSKMKLAPVRLLPYTDFAEVAYRLLFYKMSPLEEIITRTRIWPLLR